MSSTVFHYPHLKAVKITGDETVRSATITWPASTYRKKAAILLEEQLKQFAGEYMLKAK
jgi:LysR family cyn operon transcriptional activator